MKRQKRKVTKAIAIVGEGMSEWLYFDYIRTDRRYPFELRPDLPKHSDYRTVFAHAKKLLSSGYDFVFCVVDVDTIVAQNKQEEFIKACHSLDGKLIPITSNPCIEFWFLLYLWERPVRKYYATYADLLPALRKYYPDYDKSRDYMQGKQFFRKLESTGNINRAMENSEKILKGDLNPSNFANRSFSEVSTLLKSLEMCSKCGFKAKCDDCVNKLDTIFQQPKTRR